MGLFRRMGIVEGKRDYQEDTMKRKLTTLAIAVVVAVTLLTGCKALERGVTDIQSSISGLDRVVEVYSADGDLLKTFTGQLDIETNEFGNKVKFELNGKRVIIYNALVVVEEK